jgi:hypothetical protein
MSMSARLCIFGCGTTVIRSESDGKYYEQNSHKLHNCRTKKKSSNAFTPPPSSSSSNLWFNNYPKKTASVIECPYRGCIHSCVQKDETQEPLQLQLARHLETEHDIIPSKFFIDRLAARIFAIRSTKSFKVDRFIAVDLDEVTRTDYTYVHTEHCEDTLK